MEPAAVFREIEEKERRSAENKVVVLLLLRPQSPEAEEIIKDFTYYHYNTGYLCNVYAAGFSRDGNRKLETSYREVTRVNNCIWYYSDQAFYDLKEYLKYILDWEYNGESAVLVLQNNPGEENSLNFSGCISIDLGFAIRRGFSFARFMEVLVDDTRRVKRHRQGLFHREVGVFNIEQLTKDAFLTSMRRHTDNPECLYQACASRVLKPSWCGTQNN